MIYIEEMLNEDTVSGPENIITLDCLLCSNTFTRIVASPHSHVTKSYISE